MVVDTVQHQACPATPGPEVIAVGAVSATIIVAVTPKFLCTEDSVNEHDAALGALRLRRGGPAAGSAARRTVPGCASARRCSQSCTGDLAEQVPDSMAAALREHTRPNLFALYKHFHVSLASGMANLSSQGGRLPIAQGPPSWRCGEALLWLCCC